MFVDVFLPLEMTTVTSFIFDHLLAKKVDISNKMSFLIVALSISASLSFIICVNLLFIFLLSSIITGISEDSVAPSSLFFFFFLYVPKN